MLFFNRKFLPKTNTKVEKTMKRLPIILLALCAFTLSNCGIWSKSKNTDHLNKIEDSVPEHAGPLYATGQHDVYQYEVYARSVDFKAPGVILPSRILVFDLNQDNRFDTVFIYDENGWQYGSTREIRKKYRVLEPNLSNRVVMRHINAATKLKWQSKKAQTSSPTATAYASIETRTKAKSRSSPTAHLTKREKKVTIDLTKTYSEKPSESAEQFNTEWIGE